MKTNYEKTLAEIKRLEGLLVKYRHQWKGARSSTRMQNWVTSLNLLLEKVYTNQAWKEHCTKRGVCSEYNAGDILA